LINIIRSIFLLGLGCVFSCSGTVKHIEPYTYKGDRRFQATIYRDTMGIPHIFGETDADAVFGLAYAHAEDDFKTIQDLLMGARGILASEYGPKLAPVDYYVHLIGVWDDINTRYEQEVSDDIKRICEAYAAGINKYAGENKSERISRLFPLKGRDIIAGWMYQIPYLYGIERIIGKLFKEEKPTFSLLEKSLNVDMDPMNIDLIGSNVIGVSPQKSSDGHTRLLVNTHQPWTGPVAWYEAHMNSKEGINMVGGLFPGSPFVNHGHNPHLGWSFTSNSPDLVDVFELEINPNNENQYMFDGVWKDLETKDVNIEVKLWGPIKWTVTEKIYRSVHGPVLKRPHGTYAIRYSGMHEMRTLEQFYRMNKSKNLNEFKEAMKMQALPMYNAGYADKSGNIFYVYNAMIPKRSEAYDWSGYVPGNTSDALWEDYIAFEDLPQTTNPPGGYFQNCNANPFLATGKREDISPKEVSLTTGIETHQTNRSMRVIKLFDNDSLISREEFLQYKYDRQYEKNSVMAYAINRLVEDIDTDDLELLAAVDLLKNWNLRTDIDNRAAALAIMTFPLKFDIADYDHNIDRLMIRLRDSINKLKTHYGRFDVPLGDVQRIVRGDIDLPLDGGPGNLRAIYTKWEDGKLVAHTGDCYFQVVEWDQNGKVSAQSIHQYGSAVNDKNSKFYNNQSPLFSSKRMKPVWMDLEDIKLNLHSQYTISYD
tara:strand:+ start:847 stop:2970 length:2124 start_codon:yes stop_codon:yes gene_type:complete